MVHTNQYLVWFSWYLNDVIFCREMLNSTCVDFFSRESEQIILASWSSYKLARSVLKAFLEVCDEVKLLYIDMGNVMTRSMVLRCILLADLVICNLEESWLAFNQFQVSWFIFYYKPRTVTFQSSPWNEKEVPNLLRSAILLVFYYFQQ